MKTITLRDTYEATYYYLAGGTITGVQSRFVQEKDKKKKGYALVWIITMEVPEDALIRWESGNAVVNVQTFAAWRKRLKRKIHAML